MWIVAGLLLGLVLVPSLVGFHSGPHAHVAAAVLGLLAAGWLMFMASDGKSAPLLWVLFSADVVISAGIGVMAFVAIRRSGEVGSGAIGGRLEGAEGVAVTDLSPEGVVRVRGEEWSATCVNGTAPAGSRVQVLHGGVRLEVWGEPPTELPSTPDPVSRPGGLGRQDQPPLGEGQLERGRST